jgi:hypothetical protein
VGGLELRTSAMREHSARHHVSHSVTRGRSESAATFMEQGLLKMSRIGSITFSTYCKQILAHAADFLAYNGHFKLYVFSGVLFRVRTSTTDVILKIS